MLTLTYAHTSFQMPRVMSMLLDAICLELERSPMSPHAHADQRTPSTWCNARCATATHDLSLSRPQSQRAHAKCARRCVLCLSRGSTWCTRWDACTQPSCSARQRGISRRHDSTEGWGGSLAQVAESNSRRLHTRHAAHAGQRQSPSGTSSRAGVRQ